MKRSESVAALAKALAEAQAEYPAIPKDHTGKIQGQGRNGPYEYSYKYADLADTVEACRKINSAHGLSVSQAPEFLEGEDVLTTCLMHESGEWQESTRRLHAAKDDPQGAGSAITYARRYDYCAVLGVVADEDDDGAAASQGSPLARTRRQPPRGRATAPQDTQEPSASPTEGLDPNAASAAQIGKIAQLFKDMGWGADDMRQVRHDYVETIVQHPYANSKDLTKKDATAVIEGLIADLASQPPDEDEAPFD